MSTKKILSILFILFILVRLPFLDQINLLHDERDIVLSGWSIAQTGKDLMGKPLPIVFDNISPNNPLFAIYFAALWFLLIPVKSVFLARLPFLLISSLMVFLSFKIVKHLTNDDKKSLITTAILCFNPWIFHITRLALDIPLALVFLLSGILLYLKKKKILALILFFLTAFTYQGSRLLLPFLLVYLEVYFLIQERSWKKFIVNSFLNICFFGLIILMASLTEPGISNNRLSEIIFFDTEKLAPSVDFKRTTTLAPLQISRFFDNKITYAFEEMFVSFTRGIDISYLFKTGDYSPLNGNATTGQFFFIFIIFYLLGITSLGRKALTPDLYLLGFIIVGIIPPLLSTRGLTFSIRGVLSALGYSHLITLGVLFFYNNLDKSKLKKYSLALILFIFALNLTYFIYGYYLRRPITVGELFYENERQLANYLLQNDRKFTIYHQSPRDILLSYIFFKNEDLDLKKLQENLSGKIFSYNNLVIKRCNHKINYLKTANIIVHEVCLEKDAYDILSDVNNKRVKARIPYRDFSQKYAYFVIE